MKNNVDFSKLKVAVFICIVLSVGPFFGQNDLNEDMENSLVRTHTDKDLQWGPCPSFMPTGCTISVLHGDPTKNNLDVFFKVPANYEIPEHWHNSAERMILVSGELQVTYEGEIENTMKVGSYAFGPSSKPHKAKCVSADPCVLFIAFVDPLDAFPIVIKE
ncbi:MULTISPECIES: cupin domain-containing protein [Arenibacter]|uniref:cupin domain-containing protein n=1 Tax=Arenibacter TaxID=178469 RepID=UPI001964A0C7|nr:MULTISPECIES: cupin domain-containing protein [Arenibacter]